MDSAILEIQRTHERIFMRTSGSDATGADVSKCDDALAFFPQGPDFDNGGAGSVNRDYVVLRRARALVSMSRSRPHLLEEALADLKHVTECGKSAWAEQAVNLRVKISETFRGEAATAKMLQDIITDETGCARCVRNAARAAASVRALPPPAAASERASPTEKWSRKLDSALWLEVAGFCKHTELLSLRGSCRFLREVTDSRQLWEQLVEQRWGPTLAGALRWPGGLFGDATDRLCPRRAYERLHVGADGAVAVDVGGGYVKCGYATGRAPHTGTLSAAMQVVRMFPDGPAGYSVADAYTLNQVSNGQIRGIVWLEHDGVWSPEIVQLLAAVTSQLRIQHPLRSLVMSRPSRSDGPLSCQYLEAFASSEAAPNGHVMQDALLAAVAARAPTCIVLDVGFTSTRAVAVVDGRIDHASLVEAPVGGSTVTNVLVGLVAFPGVPVMRVKAWKERYCAAAAPGADDREVPSPEEYPDVTPESLVAPVDVLFNMKLVQPSHLFERSPQILSSLSKARGVQYMCAEAAAIAGSSVHATLLENIVLAGGSTSFRGFPERLEQELGSLADSKVRVLRPDHTPAHAVWRGAATAALVAVASDAQSEIPYPHPCSDDLSTQEAREELLQGSSDDDDDDDDTADS